MSRVKKYVFIFFCLLSALKSSGQAARSPFTTLNIGETYNNALINTQGMAGIGVSQPQAWYLNNQNPALLVYNQLTVFQAGLLVERRTLSNDTASAKTTDGNMNYLVTAFPIKPNRWTTSLGLMPFSSVNYRLEYIGSVANTTDSIYVKEEGSGGLTQLYWSNGVRINKNFAIGLKASYIFSSILYTHTNQLAKSQQPANYPVAIEKKTYVKDVMFSGGISYSKDSLFRQKKYRLSIGAVYSIKSDLNAKNRYRIYRVTAAGKEYDPDTLRTTYSTIQIPSSITAGISLSHSSKWTVGTEFTYQDWSTFRSLNRNDQSGSSWRAALGAEVTPSILGGGFFKRLTYRIGASYERTPFLVDVNPDPELTSLKEVNDIGANFGFSIPAGKSSLDFAFRYGKRGDKKKTILEENYFKVYFGITFNDQWFRRYRFD